MYAAPRPARNEVSDVANAVIEGADCLLLSKETTFNDLPEKSIQQVVKCCLEAEKIIDMKKWQEEMRVNSQASYGTAESPALAAVQASIELGISLIIAHTENGCLGRMVAKYKPSSNLLVCSFRTPVVKQLQILRGVHTYKILNIWEDKENIVDHLVEEAKKKRLCKAG